MGLEEVVDISITANTTGPTRQGFSTGLFLTYHTANTDLVRTYSSSAAVLADGHDADYPAYKAAVAWFSQDPHPKTFKIGRLTAAPARTVQLVVTTATEGAVISATVQTPDGVEHAITRTVPASSSTTAEATAVAALIAALTGTAATSSTATITVTAEVAGQPFYISDVQNMTLSETTADANYDDALSAIQLVDDDWYGVMIDSDSSANILAVAAWAETNKKLFGAQVANAAELTSGGTIGAALKAASYSHTFPIFSRDMEHYAAVAWMAEQLARDPGSATAAYKTLVGVTPDALTATERGYLEEDNINHYTTLAGINITRPGKVASGEWIDVIVGIDWLKARIQERVFGLIANADKIPYTDAGVELVKSEIRGQLTEGVRRDFLAADPAPTVTAPLVADVANADKIARRLPDIEFGATLAGAIHTVAVRGTLSV